MTVRPRNAALSAGALGLVAVAVSCREPTQVTIVLTTGEKCGDLSSVQTLVSPDPGATQSRFEQRFTTASTANCEASGFIGTLVVVPGGAGATVLVAAGVRVSGAPPPDPASCALPETAKRCIIARRSFAFLDHTSLVLPIHLDPLCVGTTCDPASTCFKGTCVDATVTCNGSDCGLPQERPGAGGGGRDAGSSDGAYDADLDGSGFDDASRDGGDAANVDGGANADGSVDPSAPACGNQGSFAYCYDPSAGRTTPGACSNPGDSSKQCCRCTCTITQTVVSCDTSMSAGQSCHPTCP